MSARSLAQAVTGWSAAAFVAAAAVACSGGSESAPLPRISSVVAERDVVDGEAKLSSTVKVTLDREFEIAQGRVPFASNFEFTVPLAEGGTARVLVRSAERESNSTRVITLKVDRLIAHGSTLKVQRRAFDPDETGAIEAEVEADLDPTFVLLASQALAATEEAFYGQATTAPVAEADRDPAAMRDALGKHLQQRGVDARTYQDALDLYDVIPANIVPSPKLRAALAALTGTFAEPAIPSLLTGDNCTRRPASLITFQTPPGDERLVARVTFTGNGGRVISVNPFAEGERIEHLMPILAHEAVHCDNQDGLVEEVAATAFDGFLYLQLVAADPELATVTTRVARELNIDAVAMINSGRRLPESIGVLPSAGVDQVLPLTNNMAGSFAELVAAAYPTITQTGSPTERLAKTYADILAEVSGMPQGDPFNLQYLDELLARSIDGGVIATAIVAFGLAPTG